MIEAIIDAVAVLVRITNVADSVIIEIELIGIGIVRAIVDLVVESIIIVVLVSVHHQTAVSGRFRYSIRR